MNINLTDQLRFVSCHQLIEDVVAPLSRQLEGHARLLQQICQSKVQKGVMPV